MHVLNVVAFLGIAKLLIEIHRWKLVTAAPLSTNTNLPHSSIPLFQSFYLLEHHLPPKLTRIHPTPFLSPHANLSLGYPL